MPGGAAAKAKAKEEADKKEEEMKQEYSTWHSKADRTEDTGVMRLLVVSMVLEAEQQTAHAITVGGNDGVPEVTTSSCLKPSADGYDNVYDYMHVENCEEGYEPWRGPIGWDVQSEYEQAIIEVRDAFFHIWTCIDWSKPHPEQGDTYSVRQGGIEGITFDTEKEFVKIIRADELEYGAWPQGPTTLLRFPESESEEDTLWDYQTEMKKRVLQVYQDLQEQLPEGMKKEMEKQEGIMLLPPWKIEGDYAEIERWVYEGLGTTTYTGREVDGKPEYSLWSQQDQAGVLGLTDRERIMLRQAFQMQMKEMLMEPGMELSIADKNLKEEIYKLVETGPYHSERSYILQYRVKSLKKLLQNKCVFWSNTEDSLPGGSVADNTITEREEEEDGPGITWSSARTAGAPSVCKDGMGNQVMEFWKYGKLVGTLRKKYIVEDRQRLLDMIEVLTPTYKGIMKNMGENDPSDPVSNHQISQKHMQIITNVTALALDLTLPDNQEDRVACYIKTRLEQVIGPTWHVAVGRSMGFCVTAEARHFLQMRMQHLEIVIWKSEPDPSSGKKKEGQT